MITRLHANLRPPNEDGGLAELRKLKSFLIVGKDGSTGHDGFFKATCQQKSVKKLGRNGQR